MAWTKRVVPVLRSLQFFNCWKPDYARFYTFLTNNEVHNYALIYPLKLEFTVQLLQCFNLWTRSWLLDRVKKNTRKNFQHYVNHKSQGPCVWYFHSNIAFLVTDTREAQTFLSSQSKKILFNYSEVNTLVLIVTKVLDISALYRNLLLSKNIIILTYNIWII